MQNATWQLPPGDGRQARLLEAELGLSRTTASVLVRRGLHEPARARAFLEGALPGHDPFALGDMREAVETIRAAVARGARVCVHGDYDADGICATALAVFLLRELGLDPRWHLPSRFEEGYGLNGQTLTRLASEVDLVLTVDCGITAVEEIAAARELGLEIVVTDHHRPGDVFPECAVVAPLKGDYPFTGLCGTAVVWKLAEALLGPGHPFLERHLDVVALATIADVVPLVDESRALALAGLRRLAQTQRAGLRALMAVAGVDPAACDEGAIGFRLAPRINASGRLCRPQAALDLLLTDDAFAAHADAVLSDEDLRPRVVVDAIVTGSELGLPLCEELARLAPFGLGNPGVTLLVDDCELSELGTVGEGKHLRFRVRQRGRDAGSAIAFGFGSQVDRFRRVGRYDVAFRLQENRWNGTVAPQLVVRRIFDADERYDELRDWLASEWRAGEEAWTPEVRQIFAELELGAGERRSLLESESFRRLLRSGDEREHLREAA
jgi:single-stranded DNA-specific DHH superfamily exonuclease